VRERANARETSYYRRARGVKHRVDAATLRYRVDPSPLTVTIMRSHVLNSAFALHFSGRVAVLVE